MLRTQLGGVAAVQWRHVTFNSALSSPAPSTLGIVVGQSAALLLMPCF
jgi:hypothetical protein